MFTVVIWETQEDLENGLPSFGGNEYPTVEKAMKVAKKEMYDHGHHQVDVEDQDGYVHYCVFGEEYGYMDMVMI